MEMKVLTIDVGGSHVKLRSSAGGEERRADSGPKMTGKEMVAAVKDLARGLDYDAITMGYPGPVRANRVAADPANLGPGWVGVDYAAAFGKPLRIVNDALMQAIGSYRGGKMLFLGLGTGLGTALIDRNHCLPLEIGHLPYRKGRSFEDYLGNDRLESHGRKDWLKHVTTVVAMMTRALTPDYIVLGGGNVEHVDRLPPLALRGDNDLAFTGGYRVWTDQALVDASNGFAL